MSNPPINEMIRLHKLGLAPHWIKVNSKAPVKSGWASGSRDSIATLKALYREGYGLGVRLGEASRLADGGYLANIDVDIKSSDPRHKEEAFLLLEKKFPGIKEKAASIKTGYGFRYCVRTETPIESGKVGGSSEETVVLMPNAPVNKQQLKAVERGLLTKDQLDEGYRVRPAWEIEIMSKGRQVVLPPSIHPDTGRPYVWEKVLKGNGDLPLVAAVFSEVAPKVTTRGAVESFTPVEVTELELEYRLGPKYTDMIVKGEGADDRSAACYTLCKVMEQKGFTEKEILSVLTDRAFYLGDTGFDHVGKGSSRDDAAAWIRKYCLAAAREKISTAAAFAEAVVVSPPLTPEEALAQTKELCGERPWEEKLKRTKAGKLMVSVDNVEIILRQVSPTIFRKDLFANQNVNGVTPPWGGVVGEDVIDLDITNIKMWLAKKWGIEPSNNMIYDAVVYIANINKFHPVRDFLKGLAPWDGTKRLDTWLAKHFKAEGPEEYLAQVFRKWMVAAVARVMDPGCKFDWMLLLEGEQGIGKSRFGSLLFSQEWFSDQIDKLGEKDSALGLQGNWCVEVGELSAIYKSQVETAKSFFSRRHDKFRPPYGRVVQQYRRQNVFIATTNRDTYLKDDTGNRRYRPVKVRELDAEQLIEDREKLWAEAYYIYQNKLEPSLELTGVGIEQAREMEHTKRVESEQDNAEHMLSDFITAELAKPEKERFDFGKFRMKDLFSDQRPFAEWTLHQKNLNVVGSTLRKFEAVKWKSNGLAWWRLTNLNKFKTDAG